jgi:hypothetical protein
MHLSARSPFKLGGANTGADTSECVANGELIDDDCAKAQSASSNVKIAHSGNKNPANAVQAQVPDKPFRPMTSPLFDRAAIGWSETPDGAVTPIIQRIWYLRHHRQN